MDKEKRQIHYSADLKLYDVICTIVNDCIMNEARHYGVPEERARRIVVSSLRRIIRKISHTWGPCICMVPSYKKIRKWDIYREGLTKNKKEIAKKYGLTLQYTYHIMRKCAKEQQQYAGLPWDLLPWYIRLAWV